MNEFAEKTILPELQKEGFVKIEHREIKDKRDMGCSIYLQYKHNDKIYSGTVDYYIPYEEIKPETYFERIKLYATTMRNKIENFEELNKRQHGYKDIERLSIVGFIDSQMYSIYKHTIDYQVFDKMRRKYESHIKYMLKDKIPPADILETIKSKYAPK